MGVSGPKDLHWHFLPEKQMQILRPKERDDRRVASSGTLRMAGQVESQGLGCGQTFLTPATLCLLTNEAT